MNDFDREILRVTGSGLYSLEIGTLQVNVGLRCNQECRHCHLEASPRRAEMMEWTTMERVLEAAKDARCRLVDLTGGAPELNPHFCRFVQRLSKGGHRVQVRTNLTVLMEPGMEAVPEFLRDHQVSLVASMPCYLRENVRAQRGEGVYEKCIAAMKRLNALGYGVDPVCPLHLVYNPGGPFLPPEQSNLEAEYRRELRTRFGIAFTRLLTITNMPIGRFATELSRQNQAEGYWHLLQKSFNSETVESLMCRHQLSIGWDGTLYDCDFNLALSLPVDHGAPDHVHRFDLPGLVTRRIVTGKHCFGCTAGFGSSCGGALL